MVPASPAPHLCAGGPSMMMLIHRICMALRGLGRLHMVDRAMRLKAAMLLRAQVAEQGAVSRASRADAALGPGRGRPRLTCSAEIGQSF